MNTIAKYIKLQILKHPMLPWNKDIKSRKLLFYLLWIWNEWYRRNKTKKLDMLEINVIHYWMVSHYWISVWNFNKVQLYQSKSIIMENWEIIVYLGIFADRREYRNVFGFINPFESNTLSNIYWRNLILNWI